MHRLQLQCYINQYSTESMKLLKITLIAVHPNILWSLQLIGSWTFCPLRSPLLRCWCCPFVPRSPLSWSSKQYGWHLRFTSHFCTVFRGRSSHFWPLFQLRLLSSCNKLPMGPIGSNVVPLHRTQLPRPTLRKDDTLQLVFFLEWVQKSPCRESALPLAQNIWPSNSVQVFWISDWGSWNQGPILNRQLRYGHRRFVFYYTMSHP